MGPEDGLKKGRRKKGRNIRFTALLKSRRWTRPEKPGRIFSVRLNACACRWVQQKFSKRKPEASEETVKAHDIPHCVADIRCSKSLVIKREIRKYIFTYAGKWPLVIPLTEKNPAQ